MNTKYQMEDNSPRKRPKYMSHKVLKTSDTGGKVAKVVVHRMKPSQLIKAHVDQINSGFKLKPKSEIEDYNRWWTEKLNKEKGDSSKVIEISDDDDDEDDTVTKLTEKVIEADPPMHQYINDQVTINDTVTKLNEKVITDTPTHQYITTTRPSQDQDTSYVQSRESLKLKFVQRYKELSEMLKKSNASEEQKKELKKKIADHLSSIKDQHIKRINDNQNRLIRVWPDSSISSHDLLSSSVGLEASNQKSIQSNQYFCIFCPEILKTCESAKDHYLAHLGLYLECSECHQKFPSIQLFRKHNTQHMDRSKMINLEDFMYAKKWSDNYIDNFVDKPQDLKQSMVYVYMFCPVCFKIRDMFTDKVLTIKRLDLNDRKERFKSSFDEHFVRNHLYEHFQYFPYECIDCQLEDKKSEFCLNEKARKHLLDVHNIDNALKMDLNELKTYFSRRKMIKRLEVCVEDCLSSMKKAHKRDRCLASKTNKNRIFKH